MKMIPWSVALLATVALSTCATLDPNLLKKKPTASLEKLDIHEISFQDITLKFDIKVHNPYPLAIKLAGVHLNFTVENQKFLETQSAQGLHLPANGSKINSFLVSLRYADLARVVKAYQAKDYLNTQIDGKIAIALPRIGVKGFPTEVTVPFRIQKQIPAIKPVVSIRNFRVEMPKPQEIIKSLQKSGQSMLKPDKVVGFLGAVFQGDKKKATEAIKPPQVDLKLKVRFQIELSNQTRAALNFNSLNYIFYTENQELLRGSTANVQRLGTKVILDIVNEFSLKSLSESVVAAFKKRDVQFRLAGSTALQLPPSIKKEPLALKIDETGRFRY